MKIAILSRNPKLFSTQRLMEEIQKAGHEAMVVDHSLCDLIIEQRITWDSSKGWQFSFLFAVGFT